MKKCCTSDNQVVWFYLNLCICIFFVCCIWPISIFDLIPRTIMIVVLQCILKYLLYFTLLIDYCALVIKKGPLKLFCHGMVSISQRSIWIMILFWQYLIIFLIMQHWSMRMWKEINFILPFYAIMCRKE